MFNCQTIYIFYKGLIRKWFVCYRDNSHHAQGTSDSVLSKEYIAYEVLPNITTAIKGAFPDTTVIPVLGNHDYFPKSRLPGNAGDDIIYNAMYSLWGEWIPRADEIIFKQGRQFISESLI